MLKTYSNIICIHPKDVTTDFLRPLGKKFDANYLIIEDNEGAHTQVLNIIEGFTEKALVVFLGHGHSHCLSGSNTEIYSAKTFIDVPLANKLFKKHDILLLACRSSEFIKNISPFYNSIIGFGNILSSLDEVSNEAMYETGVYRNLDREDIDNFNDYYVKAISKSFEMLFKNKIIFNQIPYYISYFLNKEINKILKNKKKTNRIELAKLLFEFRNEMTIKTC